MSPLTAAVVLCVDEKSGVQALDRTQPLFPLTFDKTEKRTHDYVRQGTVNLFGALDVATGKVTGRMLSAAWIPGVSCLHEDGRCQVHRSRYSRCGGQSGHALHAEVVPALVDFLAAVPRVRPAVR